MNTLQQSILNRIASGETSGSPGQGYNQLYGGHEFRSLKDHPRIPIPIPGSSQVSTAAGRYQITAPTWDRPKSQLGLKDFSPASQDTAALALAKQTYQQKTGRDLEQDAALGQVSWPVLGKQWTSLGNQVRNRAMDAGPGATALPETLGLIAPMTAATPVKYPTLAPIPAGNALALSSPQAPPGPVASWLRPVDYNPFEKEDAHASN